MAACAMMATSANAMYIIGAPAGDWSPAVGIEMEEVDGGWKWEGTVSVNDYFAFATELDPSGNWDNFNSNYRLSPDGGDGTVAIGGSHTMHLGAPDCAFRGTGIPVTYFVKEENGVYTLEVTNGKMYLIGALTDPQWSPAVGIEMEAVDGGWKWEGTVEEDQYFTFATNLEPSGDWGVFNANYRLSPDGGDGTAAYTGTYSMHFGTPEGAFHGTGLPVTYIVKVVNGTYMLEAIEEGGTPVELWSVIGAFNNWEGDVDMARVAPGVYSVTMDVLEGEFKFRKDHSWDVNYGAEALPTGSYDECRIALNGDNFWIAPSFRPTLTLDLNTQMLYISLPDPLGMRGTFNNWGWNDEYLFTQPTPGIFTLSMDTLTADDQFKVSNESWSENYGGDVTDMVPGQTYNLYMNGDNMGVAANYKNIVWTVNLFDNTISFEGDIDTSVANLEVENGAARYYNLQGVEVSAPQSGLYIRVANGRTEKVIIK